MAIDNVFDFVNALGLYSSMGNAISEVDKTQEEIKQKYLDALGSNELGKKDAGLTLLYSACLAQSEALKALITATADAIIENMGEQNEEGDDQ